jgi:hypothetical protein
MSNESIISEAVSELAKLDDSITKRRIIEGIIGIMNHLGITDEWIQDIHEQQEVQRNIIRNNQ